jgi:hypothetical protein
MSSLKLELLAGFSNMTIIAGCASPIGLLWKICKSIECKS